MNVQHFSIPLSRFDTKQLPPDARHPGTQAFDEAVVRYFAEKYATSGLSALVEMDDSEIRVTAFPSSFSDPLHVALSLLSQGDLKEALPILESLARVRPADPEVLYNLGIAHSELSEFDKAVMRLKQLVTVEPAHANGLVGIGVAYQRLGQPSLAEEYLKRAVDVDPSNHYAHRNLGSVLASARKFSPALRHLRTANELAPDDAATMFGLAKCLQELGGDDNLAEADGLFKEIIQQNQGSKFDELAKEARTAIAAKNLRSEAAGDLRPDVIMYITGALDTFAQLGDAKRREIAFEVAMLGTQGLDINDPSKIYELQSLPGKFSGLHLLSIMYAAFRQMDPTLDAGVDFSKEYAAAMAFRAVGK